ncbi:MAG: hypothetical protein ACRD2O_16190 [Terriglobia bacterium]
MRSIAFTWLLALVLNSPLAAVGASRAAKTPGFQERLQAHVAGLDETGLSPIHALIHTVFEYQLPFALEYVDRNAVKVEPRIKLPQGTVQKRIESLVRMLPGFSVSFSSGLVDVYSPAARAEASNLLNVVLPHFKVQHLDAGLADAMVFDALVAQKTRNAGVFNEAAGAGGPPLTIDAHNIRVYEALNRVVSEQGHSMWIVGAPPEKLSKLDGDLWHFHILNSALEPVVAGGLLDLFPSIKHQN